MWIRQDSDLRHGVYKTPALPLSYGSSGEIVPKIRAFCHQRHLIIHTFAILFHMNYALGLPERPFRAIQKGTKKVEGRVPNRDYTLPGKNIYAQMKQGDTITFTNEATKEIMTVDIMYVNHYSDVKTMLEKEGVENVLSGEPKTIAAGIAGYYTLHDYEKNIPLFGIYAIGVKPQNL